MKVEQYVLLHAAVLLAAPLQIPPNDGCAAEADAHALVLALLPVVLEDGVPLGPAVPHKHVAQPVRCAPALLPVLHLHLLLARHARIHHHVVQLLGVERRLRERVGVRLLRLLQLRRRNGFLLRARDVDVDLAVVLRPHLLRLALVLQPVLQIRDHVHEPLERVDVALGYQPVKVQDLGREALLPLELEQALQGERSEC